MIMYRATSRVTTAPDAMTAPAQIVTSGLMIAPWPIQVSGPRVVRRAARAVKKAGSSVASSQWQEER